MADQEQDELDLAAFRYVAGEMTPDEAIGFEVRLADDQPAREAVSRAVALAERLAEAGPAASPLVARRADYWWAVAPLAWMTAGAAVALVGVSVLGRPFQPMVEAPPSISKRPSVARLESAPADAAVWARLQTGQDWAADELDRLDEPLVEPEEGADLPGAAELPSWILAVTNQSNRGRP